MAEILRYVDPNSTAGGDGTTNALTGNNRAYVSLNAWEAATQQDLTDGGGDTARVVCSSDDAGSTHAADTTSFSVNGWTTNATCYIQIEAASSHGGKWNDNIYRREISGSGSNSIYEEYVKIYRIQFRCVDNSAGAVTALYYQTFASTHHHTLAYCIFRGAGSGTGSNTMDAVTTSTATLNANIYNNLFYDWKSAGQLCYGLRLGSSNTGTFYVMNNTFHNCGAGIRVGGTTAGIAINNLVAGAQATYSYIGTFAAGTDNNSTDSTDNIGTGSNNRVSQTFTFIDEAGDDFHLASNDAGARDYGVSDPGSGLFSDDIDGVTRTGTWDIGADEYVAAGGSPYSLAGEAGAFAYTGIAAALRAARLIAGASGSFTHTGSAAALRAARLIAGASGSFIHTGTAAALIAARKAAAASGEFSLTGTAAGLRATRVLPGASGSFAETGTAVALKAGRLLAAGSGSYTLAGQDVTLVYTPVGAYVLTADGGVFQLTGTAAELKAARKIVAAGGSFDEAGTDVLLVRGRLLNAASGEFTLSGTTAALLAGRKLAAASGEYVNTGHMVTLVYSGAVGGAIFVPYYYTRLMAGGK